MGHHTPLSPASQLSPKSLPPTPHFNHFSPLSPDMFGKDPLDDSGASSAQYAQAESRVYSRAQLLALAKRRGHESWSAPRGMGRLEEWYGIVSPVSSFNSLPVDDPAIASFGPPTGAHRRPGGFGEGFGFGGGIGGKNLGRGGRQNVKKYEQDPGGPSSIAPRETFSGQMGRFAVKPVGERMKLGGEDRPTGKPRREEDWRRDKAPASNRQWHNRAQEDDAVEPAWMADTEPTPRDPAIADSGNDPLIKFVPGEDMIAAHKRAMKAKAEGQWREEKPLASFFGGNAPAPAAPVIPRSFNAADYLLPSKDAAEEEPMDTAFHSRFQKFFAPPPQVAMPPVAPTPLPPPPPTEDAPRVDDHMARLMGLLTTKAGVVSVIKTDRQSQPPAPPSASVPMLSPPPTDPLQLLAHAQRQTMMPNPSHPPGVRLSGQTRPTAPQMPPHYENPHSGFLHHGPPPVPYLGPSSPNGPGFLPTYIPHHGRHPIYPAEYLHPPPPLSSNTLPAGSAHQEMLASLFSGLRPP